MKLKIILITIVLLSIMISCCTSQKAPAAKEIYTPEMQKIIGNFPDITGFEKRVILLSARPADEENNMKIEIVPGRELMVDCNRHGIQGHLVKETVEKIGYDYYRFNSNGEVFSTFMACPDNTKRSVFVEGESMLANYRSNLPFVVYTAPSINVKYRLWKSNDIKSFRNNDNKSLATKEAIDNQKFYPEKSGYEKHVLYLPELKDEQNSYRKVEIIPGKTLQVDCNRHSMSGKFETGIVEGFGYDYWIFESNGNYSSTRMACPDNTLQEKFISGQTILLRYNSRLPVVIYTPKGFEVNYKIWETNGELH